MQRQRATRLTFKLLRQILPAVALSCCAINLLCNPSTNADYNPNTNPNPSSNSNTILNTNSNSNSHHWIQAAFAKDTVMPKTKSKVAANTSTANPATTSNSKDPARLHLSDRVKGASTRQEIGSGVFYYRLEYQGMVAHVVSLALDNKSFKLTPLISGDRATTSKLTTESEAVAAINGGYFNLTDGVSASYVTIDGKQVLDPTVNKALVENPSLKPFLPQIFNRSELRLYKKKDGSVHADIMSHSAPIDKAGELVSSIQGGPVLLPAINSEKEAFVRRIASGKTIDSIGTNRKAARTAVGITRGGGIVLVCIEGSRTKEFVTGATLPAVSNFLKEIGCVQALNLDGGTSTTMVVKGLSRAQAGQPQPGQNVNTKATTAITSANASSTTPGTLSAASSTPGYSIVFSNAEERKVKSVLAIVPRR